MSKSQQCRVEKLYKNKTNKNQANKQTKSN